MNDDRDIKSHPYSPDEQRVCDYIAAITKGQVGCGDDPIGFIIASHAALAQQLKATKGPK